jgi:uncharacterized protein YcaQ
VTADELMRALRRAAVDHAFFAAGDLSAAIERFGFVQADPIRAPARAQDLILRHRVVGYRAGDLERAYPTLPLVEDMVHVYGFLHRRHQALLHPRRIARRFHVEEEHPHLRRAILDYLAEAGPSHPRAVEQAIALRYSRASIVNAWGGQSNATTHMLDILQYRGLLDVTRRVAGIRIYALAKPIPDEARLTPQQRADGLIELLVRLYAPLPRASLTQLTLMLGERAIARDALRARIPLLKRRGVLRMTTIDGVEYVWPADFTMSGRDVEPTVRFLAPFDPLVWDRRRFEHLWQWTYRFEAYTPLAKRRLGYYALPLLWDSGDDARVVGWANVTRSLNKRIDVKAGYATRKPTGKAFASAFDAEVARLNAFLAKDESVDDAAA